MRVGGALRTFPPFQTFQTFINGTLRAAPFGRIPVTWPVSCHYYSSFELSGMTLFVTPAPSCPSVIYP